MLKVNGGESVFDVNLEQLNEQKYIIGLVVLNVKKMVDVSKFFQDLYKVNYDKVVIYEVLYKIELEKIFVVDVYQYLEVGCKKYLDDVFLLFVEINYFLKLNKFDVLIIKLEMVIEKELDNMFLYVILGNVFDNLY